MPVEPRVAGDKSTGRTGRPPRTSRTEILTTARHLIDRDGWEKLTVRRLATELGIGTTTLYHHVRDREDLLLLLLDEHFEHVERPQLPDDPAERIVTAALTAHDALAAWPWAAEVLTTDGFLARVGESSLWMVEAILDGAIEQGCTPQEAVHLFRSLWYHLVGEILVRAHSARRPEDPTARTSPSEHFRTVGRGRLPRLVAVGDHWSQWAAENTYPLALRAFVHGLLAQATESRDRATITRGRGTATD